MGKEREELKSVLFNLSDGVKAIEQRTGFEKYGDILAGVPELETDMQSANGAEEINEITDALYYLSRARLILERIRREPKPPEKLHKNSRGRYETSAREYTSGNEIEFLRVIDTGTENNPPRMIWIFARVEYDGSKGDYYIKGHKAVNMDGLTVRERGRE